MGNVQSARWQDMPIGHQKAVAALYALRGCAGRYYSALDAAEKELESEQAKVKSDYDAAETKAREEYDRQTARALEKCQAACARLKEECDDNVAMVEAKKQPAQKIHSACRDFYNSLPQSVSGVQVSLLDAVKDKAGAVIRAVDDQISAYRTLFNFQTAAAERERDAATDKAALERDVALVKAKKNHQFDIAQAQADFRTKCEKEREALLAGIAADFDKATLSAYAREVLSLRPNAARYAPPTDVPEFVMLGRIGEGFAGSSEAEKAFVDSAALQAGELGVAQGSKYFVLLPYAQRLADGVALLVRYAPADRVNAQSLIQPLLLKLFLTLPPGKLEATMIDPIELGASFSLIPKLAQGPNSARIIDTKIWSKERDIETAVATMRQRLENITQNYGDDQESRLKKEVVRALAVTDFPAGFSDPALKDLHAIVRNCASLGVCVLICANDAELSKLREKNGALVDEIMQSCVVTKASGKLLGFTGANMEGLFLDPDLMSDVIAHGDEIFPRFSEAVERAQLRVERFADMYPGGLGDEKNWFCGPRDEIALPIGVRGKDTVVKMVVGRGGGSTEHHALIAGQTGAGKSTLLHTLIMSALVNYRPEELQMYLLDFKEGVEFTAYTRCRLPSLRVVAINSEREFGLNVLKELCVELETRARIFNRNGVSDIIDYSRLPGVAPMPKLLLIFDEVQELFRSRGESDSITAECLSCINRLVMQGRALGIHVILACQDFRNCSGLESYFSQMAIRIAVRGSEEGARSILSADNKGVSTLQNQPAGAAIYNGGGGVESANTFFQIAYLKEEERLALLKRLSAWYATPENAKRYEDMHTRVLLANAEDDVLNPFNRLINEGASSLAPLAADPDCMGLLLGQGFGKKSVFVPELSARDRDNLLVVGRDERMALSLFELSAMSALYEGLRAGSAGTRLYIADLFAAELYEGECDFDTLASLFPRQVRLAKVGGLEAMIDELYEIVEKRAEGALPASDRIALLFFGVNRARRLKAGGIIGDGELTALGKLVKIFDMGPRCGVSSIVWGENMTSVNTLFGETLLSMFKNSKFTFAGLFDKRVAFGLDDQSMDLLVGESDPQSLRGGTAAYMDFAADVRNTHFRPYDVPAKEWMERFARACEAAGKGE